MKRVFLIVIFLFANTAVYSQNLSISELFALSNKQNWDEVNEYLLKKGWEYYESSKGDDTHYNIITWSYEKENYSDKARGWFYLYTYEEYPNKITFSFFNKQTYNLIKSGITTLGMKLIDNTIEDNEIVAKYAGPNFIVMISTAKREKEEGFDIENSITAYSVAIIKKAGVYDDDNGIKKYYDSNGNIESELTLKDGKVNGPAKSFYSNGQVNVIANIINGKKQGTSKEYDENGNLTGEYNYLNDELSGTYKIYENNKLKMIGGQLNGEKNGQFKVFDEEGRIDQEYNMKLGLKDGAYAEYYYDEGKLRAKITGFYVNGQKTGLWQTIKFKDKEVDLLESHTYVNDEKNGSFKEVNNDSIIFGTYKNGLLNGYYKVYISLTSLLFGGKTGDTTNCPLLSTGSYQEGNKNGYWKYYSLSKGLVSEGNYIDDLKSGEWKSYFENYVKDDNKPLPYSGKLFLLENFDGGIKNGKETRYGYLERIEVPCDTVANDNINPLDTCHKLVYHKIFQISYYKNGELFGPFEQKDSVGVVIEKGNFINGKKDGTWLESYVSEEDEDKPHYNFLRGNYKDGLETGTWDEFENEDYIYTKYTFSKGKLNGKTTKYNSDQKPSEEKYFENGVLKAINIYDSLGINTIDKYEITNISGKLISCVKTTFEDEIQISQGYQYISSLAKANYNFFELDFLYSTADTNDIVQGNLYTIAPSNTQINSKPTKQEFVDDPIKYQLNDNTTLFDKGWKYEGIYLIKNHKTNQVYVEGNYMNHKKNGVFKIYYYDIGVYKEQEFKENNGGIENYYVIGTSKQFTGKFIQKYDTGKLELDFKISEGLRDGKSKYYDEDGNLTKTEKYEKGKLQ